MKFLKLPTKYDVTDPRLAELEIGEQQIEDGFIYINPEHIAAFNENTEHNATTLRVTDGGLYQILLPIEQIIKMIEVL